MVLKDRRSSSRWRYLYLYIAPRSKDKRIGRKAEGGVAKIRTRSRLGTSVVGFPPSANLSPFNGRREQCYQHAPAILYRRMAILLVISRGITWHYSPISIDITHTTAFDIRTYRLADRELDREIKFASFCTHSTRESRRLPIMIASTSDAKNPHTGKTSFSTKNAVG